jgi:hypothetical protein
MHDIHLATCRVEYLAQALFDLNRALRGNQGAQYLVGENLEVV